MVGLARIVIPKLPHHVAQRGNRRQQVFFNERDYGGDLALLTEQAQALGVDVWAWCLMPCHVHLMLAPPASDALRGALSETPCSHSRGINFREKWRG